MLIMPTGFTNSEECTDSDWFELIRHQRLRIHYSLQISTTWYQNFGPQPTCDGIVSAER